MIPLVACTPIDAPPRTETPAPTTDVAVTPPDPPRRTPAPAGIATGGRHACAIRDGDVWCWGENRQGRLAVDSADDTVLRPRKVVGLGDIVEVAADAGYTCARDRSGAVWCWGANDRGQLGTGDTQAHAGALRIAGVVASRIFAGFDHACARTDGGAVTCWGSGRFADGGERFGIAPTRMPALDGADEIVIADDHDCARTGSNVVCWGGNGEGQIGDGNGGCRPDPERPSCPKSKCLPPEICEASPTPAAVIGLPEARAIAVANRSSCALDAAGATWCWGRTPERPGFGAVTDARVPRKLSGLVEAIALDHDGGRACIIAREDASVWCWGANVFGELGIGSTAHDDGPAQVVGLVGVEAVSLGLHSSCARARGGDIWCWGDNGSGQLGDGTTERRNAPVRVGF